MFPRQDRDTRRLFSIRHLWDRHHRQRGEDAVAVAHFQGHGVEQPLPDRIAAQRPREVRRIGSGPTSGDRFGANPLRVLLPAVYQLAVSRPRL